ncbi:MAG: NUDIX domain-containing protein [Candidatus Paceibacterota bacterium]|jgi:ADP-ribose pyrophosphatase YjhB (NUDIX family)
MENVTLCICLRDKQILLGIKKRGPGTGKWNAYGGHVEAGEEEKAAAVRELEDECGLRADVADLRKVALIQFDFGLIPAFMCHVYMLRKWQGETRETEEMGTHTWFPLSAIPYTGMWAADKYWLSMVLYGATFRAHIMYSVDGSDVISFVPMNCKFR